MGSGPAPFSEIGKRVRDLLTKDYNFDNKCVFTVPGDANLGITVTGVKLNQLFIGDICSQYRRGKTVVDFKVDTNSNISTTVTLSGIPSGVRTTLSFKIPDHQKSGKLEVQYLHDRAAVSSSVGLHPTPLLELAAAVGSNELSVGAEIAFNVGSASFTKYSAGVGFNQEDFSASIVLTDKGETTRASYIHLLGPEKRTAVAAEMVHRLSTYENTFTLGARFGSTGGLAMQCAHDWRPGSRLTLSAEYDPKSSVVAPSRVGLTLALKP
ncbi:unnamed protein product [Spirodela intermedia]|uniref:Uncharacterized protein n=1 Tax=Spirodela intermedia TaxID=51605 RepID=A0A7I8JJS1_SPIIN|nr:unnamed protein product [Spirodela intermedia]CAA6670320.1 unnamed protein product [Spirodela intermedia]